MAYNIKFNGFDLNNIVKITNVKRSILPEREIKVIEIPARDGGYLQNVRHRPMTIDVDIVILGNGPSEIRQNARMLASILNTRNNVPIVFSDDPNLTYYGVLSDKTDLDQIWVLGRGTLTFLFTDPHGYEEEETIYTTSGTVTLTNDTNADFYPVYQVIFNKKSTFFAIADPRGNVILVGNPEQVDQTPKPKWERVFWDQMDNKSLWLEGTYNNPDSAVVGGGTFESSGYYFYPVYDQKPAGATAWWGPAAKRSLSEPLSDFKVEALIKQSGPVGSVGRVEIYLLDVNGNTIGKIGMHDDTAKYKQQRGEVMAGDWPSNRDNVLVLSSQYWADFDGILSITKIGDTYEGYIAQIDPTTGKHHTRAYQTFTTPAGKYPNQLAQILIHAARYGDFSPLTYQWIHDIKVYKYNDLQTTEIDEIFDVGDVLEIDTMKGIITKNGKLFMEYLDVGSKFFGIPTGQTQITFFPDDPTYADVVITYKRRWLG